MKDLKSLLKVCLLKKISSELKNININDIIKKDIKDIISKFNENVHFTGDDDDKNLSLMIKEKKIINILIFSEYLTLKSIDSKKIKTLLNLLGEKKKDLENYWRCLSSYEEYSYFEEQLKNDLKKCKFDYSLVSMNILERDNPEEYEKKKRMS